MSTLGGVRGGNRKEPSYSISFGNPRRFYFAAVFTFLDFFFADSAGQTSPIWS
jgi:hypothetical protein